MVTYPTVWGGSAAARKGQGPAGGCSGHLFAFSGLDGPTNEENPFIGIARDNSSLSLLFCNLLIPRILLVRGAGLREKTRVAASDVVLAGPTDGSGPQLQMAWSDRYLLAGEASHGAGVYLMGDMPVPSAPNCTHVSGAQAVVLCSRSLPDGGRVAWGLAMGITLAEAVSRAMAAACSGPQCLVQLPALIKARLAPFDGLPTVKTYGPLLAKALSVMRVNSLSPEGKIRQRWSTPDRVPHQWMWLWDSCYHSLAANHLDPALGWDYIHAVLAAASPDGAVAIERTPTSAGQSVKQTQPPLLTWAVHTNWKASIAAGVDNATISSRLAYALPRLGAYLQWDIVNRADPTGRCALLRWTHGTESGMDNSPRFDHGVSDMLAVDFSVFLAREAKLLAEIATEVGNATAAAHWATVAKNVSQQVHAMMWNETAGLYFDRNASSGQLSGVVASTALLPLWLDDLPPDRLPRLLAALKDPKSFGTAVPIPSVGRAMPSFGTDMWRGPMWVNSNYMVSLALGARGAKAEAAALMRATLDAMQAAYLRYGVIFEFYDADGKADPRTLMRKGEPTGGVRDYHWSAALAYDAIMRLAR